jgi:hypothetical protein
MSVCPAQRPCGCLRNVVERLTCTLFKQNSLIKKSPSPGSASELYRTSYRRLSAKLVPTFAGRGCHVVSVTDPCGRILGFLDLSRYFSFQVAPQLYSRGWVDPVPDPIIFRKSGSAGNRTATSGSVARNCDLGPLSCWDYQAHGAYSFLRIYVITKEFSECFMEVEGSLPCQQEPSFHWSLLSRLNPSHLSLVITLSEFPIKTLYMFSFSLCMLHALDILTRNKQRNVFFLI